MVVATPVYIYDNSRNDKAIKKNERKKGTLKCISLE